MEPDREDVSHRKKVNVIGDVFVVLNIRYVDDCNMLVNEIRSRVPDTYHISDSFLLNKDEKLMWVDKAVLDIVKNNKKIMKEIFDNYPEPSKENE